MRAILRTIAFSLILLGAALPAPAEIDELGFASLAQYRAFDTRSSAPVAKLADGSFAVVWREAFEAVRLQWVRPDGSLALASGGLPLGKIWNADPPVVAAHPVTGAFAAFSLWTRTGSRIVVQSFDGKASPRWRAGGVVALDSPGFEYQKYPQILAAPDGGVFVCFVRDSTSTPSAIVCQRLGPDGTPLWPGGRIAEAKPGSRSDTPILVADGAGGVLVFWSNPVRTTTTALALPAAAAPQNPISLKGQRFAPDGSPLWGPRGKVLHQTSWWEPAFQSTRAFAVPDGAGGAILAFPDWRRQANPLTLGVVAQRVNRDGELLWGQGVTIERSPNYPTIDSLTAHPSGGAVAVVQEWQGNSRFRLVLFRLGPGGRARRPANGLVLSVPDRIQQDYGSQGSFDGGRLRILWTSQGIFNSFPPQVRIAVFEPDGRRLSAPDAAPLVPGEADGGHFFAGFAFDARRNQGLAIWNDFSIPDFLTAPAGALFGGNAGVP